MRMRWKLFDLEGEHYLFCKYLDNSRALIQEFNAERKKEQNVLVTEYKNHHVLLIKPNFFDKMTVKWKERDNIISKCCFILKGVNNYWCEI